MLHGYFIALNDYNKRIKSIKYFFYFLCSCKHWHFKKNHVTLLTQYDYFMNSEFFEIMSLNNFYYHGFSFE